MTIRWLLSAIIFLALVTEISQRVCAAETGHKPSRIISASLLFLVVAAILAVCYQASARDLGQWEDTDPAIRHYYQHLMQPSNPAVSCCGVADAYWTDSFETNATGVFAIITDDRDDIPLKRKHIDVGTRILIPSDAFKFGPQDPQSIEENKNPTGHGIVFVSRGGIVYCYVTPGGV